MAGTEGENEMDVLKTLVNSLVQSVQTLTSRQDLDCCTVRAVRCFINTAL